MFTESLIIAASLIHIAAFLKHRKINFKLSYTEAIIILTIGLLGWLLLIPNDPEHSLFALYTGKWYIPVQPIDLIFLGTALFTSAATLDFITKHYNLNRNSMLTVLPWTITAQYRFLHEFVWTFQYWITINIANGKFSDIVPAPDALGGGINWPIAVLTHFYALMLTIFTIFNLVIIIRETKNY